MRALEKETRVFFSSNFPRFRVFGSFRQDTESTGLTFGPRVSFSTGEGSPEDRSGTMNFFADAGLGYYYTKITATFPRREKGHTITDATNDLGASAGAGLSIHIGDHAFLGLGVRYHVVFVRFYKDESWLEASDIRRYPARELVFADQKGGCSADLGFVTGGLMFGIAF